MDVKTADVTAFSDRIVAAGAADEKSLRSAVRQCLGLFVRQKNREKLAREGRFWQHVVAQTVILGGCSVAWAYVWWLGVIPWVSAPFAMVYAALYGGGMLERLGRIRRGD